MRTKDQGIPSLNIVTEIYKEKIMGEKITYNIQNPLKEKRLKEKIYKKEKRRKRL